MTWNRCMFSPRSLDTSIVLARWPESRCVTPPRLSPLGFEKKRYCRASSCNCDRFSSKSDHCRVIAGMSYKVEEPLYTRWQVRVKNCVVVYPIGHLLLLSIYLLCRATGRRTTKKDRTEGSSSLIHYREKKIEGVKEELGKGMKGPWENRTYTDREKNFWLSMRSPCWLDGGADTAFT